MATFTTNYNLRKPDGTDFVEETTDLNANFDTIDTELKAVSDARMFPVFNVVSTSDSAGISAESLYMATDLLSLKAGFTYRVTLSTHALTDTATAFTTHRLKHSTVTAGTSGTTFVTANQDHRASTRVEALTIVGLYTPSVDESKSFKYTAFGGGGITTIRGAFSPIYLMVDGYKSV